MHTNSWNLVIPGIILLFVIITLIIRIIPWKKSVKQLSRQEKQKYRKWAKKHARQIVIERPQVTYDIQSRDLREGK